MGSAASAKRGLAAGAGAAGGDYSRNGAWQGGVRAGPCALRAPGTANTDQGSPFTAEEFTGAVGSRAASCPWSGAAPGAATCLSRAVAQREIPAGVTQGLREWGHGTLRHRRVLRLVPREPPSQPSEPAHAGGGTPGGPATARASRAICASECAPPRPVRRKRQPTPWTTLNLRHPARRPLINRGKLFKQTQPPHSA